MALKSLLLRSTIKHCLPQPVQLLKQRAFSVCSSLSSSSVEVVDSKSGLTNSATPWLKLHPEVDPKNSSTLECFYSPAENKVVRLSRKRLGVPDTAICFASSKGRLAYVDPTNDCPVYMSNPFVPNGDVKELAPLATMPCVWEIDRDPQTGEMLYFDVPIPEDRFDTREMDELRSRSYCGHLILSYMISNVICFENQKGELVDLALMGGITDRLFHQSNGDDEGWIELQHNFQPGSTAWFSNQLVFCDVKKLCYTINAAYGIEVFDLYRDLKKRSVKVFEFPSHRLVDELNRDYESEKSQQLKDIRNEFQRSRVYHLVAMDSGDLLLIVRHGNGTKTETLHFDVFKVNFYELSLERLKNLGDCSVFVGSNETFLLQTPDSPEIKRNCIYFTASYDGKRNSFKDCGIFDMEDNTIVPIKYPYTPKNVHPDVTNTDCWPYGEGWKESFWVSPLC